MSILKSKGLRDLRRFQREGTRASYFSTLSTLILPDRSYPAIYFSQIPDANILKPLNPARKILAF